MLFHFSEDPMIRRFEPRPSKSNGAVVWAIAEEFAFLYFFPRDCPRIVIWAQDDSGAQDRDHWLGEDQRVAYVEERWMERITQTTVYCYALPVVTFQSLDDVGMHVSSEAVMPSAVAPLTDLPQQLAQRGVALRPVSSLRPIAPVWRSSLHASGIRLRNAHDPF